MGSSLKERDRMKFPLDSVDAVVALVIDQLDARDEPNLALLSIVLGAVEQSLTANVSKDGHSSKTGLSVLAPAKHRGRAIPPLTLSTVEALYEQFVTMIKGSVDMTAYRNWSRQVSYTSPACLKKVSDVVWEACPRTILKDRTLHLQTLYTLLTDRKMDCFGMAISVIAACQVLGLSDVHLAITEDHTWAVYGEACSQSAEITWHGKGTEDKRGQEITAATADKNWLYMNPIVCKTRHLEVVAMVISINPSINAATDSAQMAIIQQELLWRMYDRGLLNKYPMSLGTLADMEEMTPTAGRPTSLALYSLAVDNTIKYCNDLYIYPYTYIGNYFYRHCQYKNALKHWATAAQVVGKYNYNREDEVLYKEFLEIANDIIPNIVRISSTEQLARSSPTYTAPSTLNASSLAAVPFLNDSECYSNLLRFYDGICKWEEGSSTPVLHIVWATHMGFSLSKFELKAREKVNIQNDVEATDNDDDSSARRPMRRTSNVPLESPESPTESTNDSNVTALKLIPFGDSSESSSIAGLGPAAAAVRNGGRASLGSASSVPPSYERVTRLAEAANADRLKLTLYSEKMMALRELLIADKLNLGAIKLQLTAQSQVSVKHSRLESLSTSVGGTPVGNTPPPPRKRTRRE